MLRLNILMKGGNIMTLDIRILAETLMNYDRLIQNIKKDHYIYTGSDCFKNIFKYIKNNVSSTITVSSLCGFYMKNLGGIIRKVKINNNDIKLEIDKEKFLTSLLHKIESMENDICKEYKWDSKIFNNKTHHLKKQISPEMAPEQETLNTLRTELSKFMQHYSEDSRIYLLNDGTGSGKTFNVIRTYLEQTHSFSIISNTKKLHSAIYVTPQKMQMKFSADIYKLAYKYNIPLLQIKSNNDLTDLDTVCWSIFNEKSGENITNKEFFEFIFNNKKSIPQSVLFKEIKNKLQTMSKKENEQEIEENIQELDSINEIKMPDIQNLFSSYHSYIVNLANDSATEEESHRCKIAFQWQMQNLAIFLITRMAESDFELMVKRAYATSINDISINNAYDLFYYIIAHCCPLEIAKYRPVVICLTADKFSYNLGFGEYKKKSKSNSKEIIYTYQSIDEIISGIKSYKGGEVSKKVASNHEAQNSFLNNEFFEKEGNVFDEKNVSFSLIIDEEHVFSTNEITKYNSIDILGDRRKSEEQEYNLIDSFAVIYRLMHNCIAGDKGQTELVRKHKKSFLNNFIDNIYNYTDLFGKRKATRINDLSKDSVYMFFSNFANNSVHLKIDANNAHYLSSICSNIYAYSPKTMLQLDSLKDIKITLDSSGVFIESEVNEKEDSLSLYDFFQIVLVVLYSCREMPKSVYNSLAERYNDSQNKSLQRLSNVCRYYKEYLSSMFDSTHYLDKDSPVNTLLVYFLSKVMFSINLQEEFSSKFLSNIDTGKGKTHYISADVKIVLSKEMFEVALLRVLQKSRNKVFLMSATRGYDNIYSGQYNIDFFYRYKDKLLPFTVLTREDDLMLKFTNKRKEKREVIVNRFYDELKENKYDAFIVNSINTIETNNVTKITKSLNSNELSVFNAIYHFLIKKTKHIYGDYKKLEMSQLIFFIALHSAKKENAMIMSLSNRYMDILKKEMFFYEGNQSFFNQGEVDTTKLHKDNQSKIFEFIVPDKNKEGIPHKVRIILFDAKLGSEPNLDKYFDIPDNTSLIFISSFNSAGTGLNFCIQNKKDFDAISFSNDPYYTSVKSDKGLNTTTNSLLKLKHMAGRNKILTLCDIDSYFNSNESYALLLKEHYLEILKIIEQAVGRVERRDFPGLTSSINFIDNELYSLFKNVLSQYFYCNNQHKGLPVINNKSLLNRSMYNVAEYFIQNFKLSNEKRNELENVSENRNKVVKDFFENDYREFLNSFRKGDPDYVFFPEFNSMLREIVCLQEWSVQKKKIILFLKQKNVSSAISSKIARMLSSVVINLEETIGEGYQDILIAYNTKKTGYTDISRSNYLYDVKQEMSFSIKKEIKDIKDCQININKDKSKQYVPVPYFNSIIRGNIGELIMRNILKKNNISYKKDCFFSENFCGIYEFFDFIIEKENKVICIDVKNWRFIDSNKGNRILNAISNKTQKIKMLFNKEVEFYYINTDPDNNGNGLSGINILIEQYKSYFFNLFVNRCYYEEKDFYSKQKRKNIKIATLKHEELTINQDFYKIFGV